MFQRTLPVRALACGACALLLTACASTAFQPRDLTGQVSYKENITLPPASTMVHLRLMNVAGSGGAADLLAEQFIDQPAHFPVRFDLRYDQHAVVAGGRYELDTQVYSEHQLSMQTAQTLTLDSSGLPDSVDVTVTPVGK
jgi:uncharacterized lipoprotein YbaY